jgi:RNA polymerase sigma factor (TIGR02999 family)
MTPGESIDLTRLLKEWGGGDELALERLAPVVYDQLHRMAQQYMRQEHPGASMQATALVHEAYLRLVNVTGIEWRDRAHFFAVSARMMRRILVDAARVRLAVRRRDGVREPLADFDRVPDASVQRGRELTAVDDALNTLAKIDRRKARVVELRFFGGLSVEQTAEVLKISAQSVMRDWKLAKAWLMLELAANGCTTKR